MRTMKRLSVLVLLATASAASAQAPRLTPEEALKRLKEGNLRHANDTLLKKDIGPARRIELVKGQEPIAVVLTCADSRVVPEVIFNKGLGDLFVLRVAGNVADHATGLLGSAEFAVGKLKVPLIVVLGHEKCGAVEAALKGDPLPGNLGKLVKSIHVGKRHAGKGLPRGKKAALEAAIRANATWQAEQILRQSDVLRELAQTGRVLVVPGVYSLITGEVTWLPAVSAGRKGGKAGER
jgi:carbonic anhydrase